jgi:hypothetical protein
MGGIMYFLAEINVYSLLHPKTKETLPQIFNPCAPAHAVPGKLPDG